MAWVSESTGGNSQTLFGLTTSSRKASHWDVTPVDAERQIKYRNNLLIKIWASTICSNIINPLLPKTYLNLDPPEPISAGCREIGPSRYLQPLTKMVSPALRFSVKGRRQVIRGQSCSVSMLLLSLGSVFHFVSEHVPQAICDAWSLMD